MNKKFSVTAEQLDAAMDKYALELDADDLLFAYLAATAAADRTAQLELLEVELDRLKGEQS